MPGTNLGTAYVQIVPSAQGISGSISSVMSGEAAEAGVKSGGLFSKVFNSKIAKGALVAGGVIAAGVGIGTAAIKKGITETAAYGDNIDKMSQKIGFSTDEYQKWDYVLQRAGTDISRLGPSMKTLSNAAISNSKAFQELGISQEELKNMSPGELFSETVKRLSEVEDVTKRTALASKLLGRGATELGPLFNEGSAAIEEQMALAEKYGMIMPESAVNASAAFQDSVTTMQMTMTGLKNRMMAEFLPAATQITDGLGKMFAGDMTGADDVVAGIKNMASKIASMAPTVLAVAKNIGKQLLDGIISHSGDIGSKVGEILGKVITLVIQNAPKILAAASKLTLNLAKGLIKQLPSVISAIGRIGAQIVRGLGSALWGKVRAAANGIKERFMAPITALKEKIKSIVDKIKGFFSFKISKPNIPMPHFRITPAGWKLGDLLKGTIPSLGISWYDKGGIFTKPNVIGVAERRPEFVGALDDLRKIVREEQRPGGDITINVYGSDNMSVSELAAAVEQRLISATRNRRLAWQ